MRKTIANWQKRKQMSYFLKQYKKLKKFFGNSTTYSIGQIDRVIKHTSGSRNHIEYAYALFTTRTEFENYKKDNKKTWDYTRLRRELSDHLFDGKRSLLRKEGVPIMMGQKHFTHHHVPSKFAIQNYATYSNSD